MDTHGTGYTHLWGRHPEHSSHLSATSSTPLAQERNGRDLWVVLKTGLSTFWAWPYLLPLPYCSPVQGQAVPALVSLWPALLLSLVMSSLGTEPVASFPTMQQSPGSFYSTSSTVLSKSTGHLGTLLYSHFYWTRRSEPPKGSLWAP